MTKTCTACGVLVEPMSQFCQGCGAPAPSPTYRIGWPGDTPRHQAAYQPTATAGLPWSSLAVATLVVTVVLGGLALLA